MTFVKTKDNNGVVDTKIYKAGRVRKNDTRSKGEIRDQELISIGRKLKSHVAKAVMTAAKILDREEAKPMELIAASKFLLENYLKIIDSVYDVEDEQAEGQEIQQSNAPVFSLRMINNEEGNKE